MPSTSALQRPRLFVFLVGLAAFAVLTLRYSPNWVAFSAFVHEATSEVTTPSHRTAIEEAVLSGFSERGLHVIRQARDLSAEIRDSNHKIVRWRLLMPAIGHMLRLPDWCTLGLAHLGCLAWIVALTALGLQVARQAGRPPMEAAGLALVAGASAPFFASMGLLGYYDSWLALALLAVAFSPNRTWVIVACLLGPWIDERFIIGLPLALVVRWLRANVDPETLRLWLKREALLPLVLTVAYALLRLKLGGSGSSQTVGEYFRQFVFNPKVSASDRLFGAWSGLLIGWILVGAGLLQVNSGRKKHRGLTSGLLAAAVLGTALVGLFTALDLSRSMALLTPVVPLGWALASRKHLWRRWQIAAVLPLAALLIPAQHVMGRFILPVDNAWSPSLPLRTAQSNLGFLYDAGTKMPRDVNRALYWYRRAAALGHAEAQNNLGAKYSLGEGVDLDHAAARDWFLRAAAKGDRNAEFNLGVVYADGIGVQKDPIEAAKWLHRAAEKGLPNAQNNLGVLYFDGRGVPRNIGEAIKWYRRAALQGMGTAAKNLAIIYLRGSDVPADPIHAYYWILLAAALGEPSAKPFRDLLESRLNPDQIKEAQLRATETLQRIQKR